MLKSLSLMLYHLPFQVRKIKKYSIILLSMLAYTVCILPKTISYFANLTLPSFPNQPPKREYLPFLLWSFKSIARRTAWLCEFGMKCLKGVSLLILEIILFVQRRCGFFSRFFWLVLPEFKNEVWAIRYCSKKLSLQCNVADFMSSSLFFLISRL